MKKVFRSPFFYISVIFCALFFGSLLYVANIFSKARGVNPEKYRNDPEIYKILTENTEEHLCVSCSSLLSEIISTNSPNVMNVALEFFDSRYYKDLKTSIVDFFECFKYLDDIPDAKKAFFEMVRTFKEPKRNGFINLFREIKADYSLPYLYQLKQEYSPLPYVLKDFYFEDDELRKTAYKNINEIMYSKVLENGHRDQDLETYLITLENEHKKKFLEIIARDNIAVKCTCIISPLMLASIFSDDELIELFEHPKLSGNAKSAFAQYGLLHPDYRNIIKTISALGKCAWFDPKSVSKEYVNYIVQCSEYLSTYQLNILYRVFKTMTDEECADFIKTPPLKKNKVKILQVLALAHPELTNDILSLLLPEERIDKGVLNDHDFDTVWKPPFSADLLFIPKKGEESSFRFRVRILREVYPEHDSEIVRFVNDLLFSQAEKDFPDKKNWFDWMMSLYIEINGALDNEDPVWHKFFGDEKKGDASSPISFQEKYYFHWQALDEDVFWQYVIRNIPDYYAFEEISNFSRTGFKNSLPESEQYFHKYIQMLKEEKFSGVYDDCEWQTNFMRLYWMFSDGKEYFEKFKDYDYEKKMLALEVIGRGINSENISSICEILETCMTNNDMKYVSPVLMFSSVVENLSYFKELIPLAENSGNNICFRAILFEHFYPEYESGWRSFPEILPFLEAIAESETNPYLKGKYQREIISGKFINSVRDEFQLKDISLAVE